MLFVPKASVRVNLAVAILLTIVLSWVLSTGISNYFTYLSFRSFRHEMLKHSNIDPKSIPPPRFGIVEFLIGRPPFGGERGHHPPPGMAMDSQRPAMAPPSGQLSGQPTGSEPPNGSFPGPPVWFALGWLLLRLMVALTLAALAGAWLGRRFTKPLTQLANGADAFQSGNFAYRIPADGRNEFTAVAAAMNEMARQVADHIDNLEKDAERRRQFLADIAHELRSPVTTMRTMAGALEDGLADEPERRDRAVHALVHTSERMQRLVLDLMELAKLDLNELPLNVRQVDLQELIESVVQSYDADAAAAGVVLSAKASVSVSAWVDPDRITQVLENIVGNAVDYAGRGAEVKVVLEDGDPIRIQVCDTGKGIRAADLPYIFDSFYRADAARTPGDGHSGLGLSIARKLVEAHGGKLTVSSEEGKGTTLGIVIPNRS